MHRPIALFAFLVTTAVAEAQNPPQGPPPQTTPVQRGSGWAEAWQARWELTPMLEVNLATGNLVCAISTGRFYREGLPPHHEVALVHNSQRADVSGDFTGGFDLGQGWSSNFGVKLTFASSSETILAVVSWNPIPTNLSTYQSMRLRLSRTRTFHLASRHRMIRPPTNPTARPQQTGSQTSARSNGYSCSLSTNN